MLYKIIEHYEEPCVGTYEIQVSSIRPNFDNLYDSEILCVSIIKSAVLYIFIMSVLASLGECHKSSKNFELSIYYQICYLLIFHL